MATRSFDLREFFHLALLRHLATRLSGRDYAVKGGICLRFFHRSPRLSQDMDVDIVSNVRLKTLQNAVDSILEGKAFAASALGVVADCQIALDQVDLFPVLVHEGRGGEHRGGET